MYQEQFRECSTLICSVTGLQGAWVLLRFHTSLVADVAPASTLKYLRVIFEFGFEGSLPPTNKILSIVGCEAIYSIASRLLVNQELMHGLRLLEATVLKTYSLSVQLFFPGRRKRHLAIT